MSRRLIVFLPNWLGDAVMALPALADIRRAWPDATIDLAARASIAPVAALVPDVNAVVRLERGREVELLKAGGYETALLFPNSFNSAWTAQRAGIPERWGYRHDFRGLLLTRAVVPPARVHQAAYYQLLTTALGFEPGPLEPRLAAPAEAERLALERLTAAGWDGRTPLVALAPGAAFGTAKRWPAARFAAAIDQLAAAGLRSVLIGASGDRPGGDEVRAAVGAEAAPLDLIGGTDLTTLAGVLRQCRALVTNDSGAMHFAAALGVRVVAIFGPTNEKETRPLGPGEIAVIAGQAWCRPCMLRECPLTHACMRSVSADVVVSHVRRGL